MEQNTRFKYINISLLSILAVVLFVFTFYLIRNKEFEKTYWGFELKTKADTNAGYPIKIIGYEIGNPLDLYAHYYFNASDEYGTKNFSSFMILRGEQIKDYDRDNKILFPSRLTLTYYSFSESKTYQLKAELPYNKIKKIAPKFKEGTNNWVILNILPQGKIQLYIDSSDNKSSKKTIIASFQAKEKTTDVKLLLPKYMDSIGISSAADFNNLIIKKYNWQIKIAPNVNSEITDFSAKSFGEQACFDKETKSENGLIPNVIYLDWKNNKQKYRRQFYFPASKILAAFEKLDSIDKTTPIMIIAEPDEKLGFRLSAQKNDIKIPLEELYAQEPTNMTE